jgi:O-antigen ligase
MSPRQWQFLLPEIPNFCMLFMMGGLTLFGGSVRHDAMSQFPALMLSIFAFAILGITATRDVLVSIKPLLIFAAAGLALCLLHLVPLPPGLWLALPGHAPFAEAAALANAPQPWRPLTLSADIGWSSVTWWIPIFAAMIAIGGLATHQIKRLLRFLLAMILLSLLLGLVQELAGPETGLRFYAITSHDVPVGFFANRNHYGLWLAMGLPIVGLWYRLERKDDRWRTGRFCFVIGSFAALYFTTLLTGSRAASIIATLAIPASIWLIQSGRTPLPDRRISSILDNKWTSPVLILCSLGVIALAASGFDVVDRLLATNATDEARIQSIPTLWTLTKTYAPFGSGIGSFVSAFQVAEPNELLDASYMNHAHNDYFELIIETGLPGALLLLGFGCWWAYASWQLLRFDAKPSQKVLLGRLGVILIAMTAIASVSDYPVRTPLVSALVAIAATFVLLGTAKKSSVAAS